MNHQSEQSEEVVFPIHKAQFQSNNKKQTRGRIAARSNVQSIAIYEIAETSSNGMWANKKLIGYRYIQHKR